MKILIKLALIRAALFCIMFALIAGLVCLTLISCMGCTILTYTASTSPTVEADGSVHEVSTDMAKSQPDLIHVDVDMSKSIMTDMLSNIDATPSNSADLLPPVVCIGSDVLCAGYCTDTTSNLNNCGGCGNVCSTGASCTNGQCLYQHHDTFCSDTWADSNSTVDGTNKAQALKVCSACCATMTGVLTCLCTQYTGFDGSAEKDFYYFNLGASLSEEFFYHDDTANFGAGKAVQVSNVSGYSNLMWWVQ